MVESGFRPAGREQSVRANRRWWDAAAQDYQREHGDFLGPGRLVWGPEGLDEADAALLGDVRGLDVLEVGCGAAQGATWLASQGARAVGIDLSAQMLAHAAMTPARPRRLVQADARALPFAAGSFDIACSAYGAVPFVADPETVMAEVARVLRPGGRWVFSVTHPVRWAFPDDPGPAGLTAALSYFDRTPYVESDGGMVTYAEHHRTLGDRVRDIVAAGLVLDDVVEPEWPPSLEQTWGAWSRLRGEVIPGTVIFVSHRPG